MFSPVKGSRTNLHGPQPLLSFCFLGSWTHYMIIHYISHIHIYITYHNHYFGRNKWKQCIEVPHKVSVVSTVLFDTVTDRATDAVWDTRQGLTFSDFIDSWHVTLCARNKYFVCVFHFEIDGWFVKIVEISAYSLQLYEIEIHYCETK